MRYRVSFAPLKGVSLEISRTLLNGLELDADSFEVEAGHLKFYDAGRQLIIMYAAETWHSVRSVGAFSEATKPVKEPTRENP